MRSATHAPGDESRQGSALLIVDMISDWSFVDGTRLRSAAAAVAPAISRLKARFRRAGAPVIYANDNHGRWRSDFRQLLERAFADEGEGAMIARLLAPDPDDYFVLKPRHSAFYATPLELLLQNLEVRRLVLTGVSSDQCLLATAADARMRGVDATVPRDAIASLTSRRTRASIRHFEEVLGMATTPGARLRL